MNAVHLRDRCPRVVDAERQRAVVFVERGELIEAVAQHLQRRAGLRRELLRHRRRRGGCGTRRRRPSFLRPPRPTRPAADPGTGDHRSTWRTRGIRATSIPSIRRTAHPPGQLPGSGRRAGRRPGHRSQATARTRSRAPFAWGSPLHHVERRSRHRLRQFTHGRVGRYPSSCGRLCPLPWGAASALTQRRIAKKKGSSPICVRQKAGARRPLLPWWYQASRRQEGDRGPGASYYPAGRLGGI